MGCLTEEDRLWSALSGHAWVNSATAPCGDGGAGSLAQRAMGGFTCAVSFPLPPVMQSNRLFSHSTSSLSAF